MTRYCKLAATGFFILLLIWVAGCDSDDGSGTLEPPVAVINVKESRFVPGRLEIDGSESQPGQNGRLVSHRYQVTEVGSGQMVHESYHTDSLENLKLKLYPTTENTGTVELDSDYLVELEVKDENGRTHRVETTVPVQATLWFINANGGLVPKQGAKLGSSSCTATLSVGSISGDSGYATIVPDTDSGCYSIDTDGVVTIVDNLMSPMGYSTTSKIFIQAFGGEGGAGSTGSLWFTKYYGGDGGGGGFAQIITTPDDLDNLYGTSEIFYFLGGEGWWADGYVQSGAGGASTIVSTKSPVYAEDLVLDDSDSSNVLLIAGGGGGGGSHGDCTFWSCTGDGYAGGAGGVAISSTTGASKAAGSDGEGDYGGEGGGSSGNRHIGGDGGTGYEVDDVGDTYTIDSPGWINETPEIEDYGDGEDSDSGNGAGGGGYGGGSQGTENDSKYYGGGGGGSYAAASTTADDTGLAATDDNYELGSGDGELVIGVLISSD